LLILLQVFEYCLVRCFVAYCNTPGVGTFLFPGMQYRLYQYLVVFPKLIEFLFVLTRCLCLLSSQLLVFCSEKVYFLSLDLNDLIQFFQLVGEFIHSLSNERVIATFPFHIFLLLEVEGSVQSVGLINHKMEGLLGFHLLRIKFYHLI
jgi:hypothetical protein